MSTMRYRLVPVTPAMIDQALADRGLTLHTNNDWSHEIRLDAICDSINYYLGQLPVTEVAAALVSWSQL